MAKSAGGDWRNEVPKDEVRSRSQRPRPTAETGTGKYLRSFRGWASGAHDARVSDRTAGEKNSETGREKT